MFSPRWRKVARDLLGNKTRTALVVLSIAVGVFAVGMIAGTQVVLTRDLRSNYNAINPAGATLYTDGFDDELAATIRHVKGVGDAQGRRQIRVRARLGPSVSRNLSVLAIPDDGKIRINQVRVLSGPWPPAAREVLMERASLDWLGVKVGDRIAVEGLDGKQRTLRVAGSLHDINQPPPFAGDMAISYATFDTIEWLGGPRDYNELHVVVAENAMDKAHVQRVADLVRDRIEASGRTVYYSYVPEPGKYPVDDAMQALMTLLGVLGFLTLLLSGFLVVNTISALLTQQTRQIGVMKAVGARKHQVVTLYLVMVLGFGLLALAVGVPLGSLAAYEFSGYMASLLNFDVSTFTPPTHVFAMQMAVGLGVPVLAALYPVLSGTGISVREALSAEGRGQGRAAVGTGLVDRLVGRVRVFSRPLLISLRNTFRRKGRLALTLSTLTLGGAIFIAVLSVRDSTVSTLDDALDYFSYDIQVDMSRGYRAEQLVYEAQRVPGVVEAQTLRVEPVRRVRPDGSEGNNTFMFALPAETSLVKPILIEGRWLLPDDDNAVVLNTPLLKDEPDVKVGDEFVLELGDRKMTWRVVGVVQGVMSGPYVYVNWPYFERVARDAGHTRTLWVVTDKHDGAYQAKVAKALEQQFKAAGMRVAGTQTIEHIRARVQSQFDIIVVFLLVMAVLLAVVGGLGLMGTMSLNVLERTREIGVMRAIGASDGAVRQVFVVEGILIGVLSWLVGAVIAFPLSKLMSDAVGNAFVQAPLSYTFSTTGAALWLVLVVVLATLSSLLPARSASRLTVRDVLAYE